ncbi:hypothetical protein AURDEDRAFT_161665 [Auricularia subglabra TFB-10046 SS5]|nr:hypothetical protein AURDEDRAFT_161665 [Auricularia subglabra TFB-10046 SS5]
MFVKNPELMQCRQISEYWSEDEEEHLAPPKEKSCAAMNGGDDAGLAALMNAVPRLRMDDARLWLAYLKDARNSPFDESIMNRFKHESWVSLLQADGAMELYVRTKAVYV